MENVIDLVVYLVEARPRYIEDFALQKRLRGGLMSEVFYAESLFRFIHHAPFTQKLIRLRLIFFDIQRLDVMAIG